MGTLYYGDNLDILRRYVADASVDLVYLDLPFKRQKFPRIQLRTIGQLLAGVAMERPSGTVAVDETFKKAPRAKAKCGEQGSLGI